MTTKGPNTDMISAAESNCARETSQNLKKFSEVLVAEYYQRYDEVGEVNIPISAIGPIAENIEGKRGQVHYLGGSIWHVIVQRQPGEYIRTRIKSGAWLTVLEHILNYGGDNTSNREALTHLQSFIETVSDKNFEKNKKQITKLPKVIECQN